MVGLQLGARMQERGIVLRGHKGATYTETPVLRRRSRGRWEYHQRWLRFMHRAAIARLLAGPIAESRVTGDLAHVGGDAREIIAHVRELLRRKHQLAAACDYKKHGVLFEAIIYVLAIPPSTMKKAMSALDVVGGRDLIHPKIVEILVSLAKDAHIIIEQNWSTVKAVANELVKKEKVSGPEVEKMFSQHR